MSSGSKKVANSGPEALIILWSEGFFKQWVDLKKVLLKLAKRGNNFSSDIVRQALYRAKFLTKRRRKGIIEYIQKKPAESRDIESIESQLLDSSLVKQLGKTFEQEINDLQLNFGRSGTCTAFLLRKILEKLIFIVFAKNGIESKVEDKSLLGGLVGLGAMIKIAAQEKVRGVPYLTRKTAQEIQGIKFLGDTSAHNPLVNVTMKTILPQLPYIITAYQELARHL